MADQPNTTRRALLKALPYVGGAALLAVSSPLAGAADRVEPDYGRFDLVDQHAAPLGNAGDVLIYNHSDRDLVEGKVYVSRTDKGRLYAVMVWEGEDGWFAASPNHKQMRTKVVGPMHRSLLQSRIVGRVVFTIGNVA